MDVVVVTRPTYAANAAKDSNCMGNGWSYRLDQCTAASLRLRFTKMKGRCGCDHEEICHGEYCILKPVDVKFFLNKYPNKSPLALPMIGGWRRHVHDSGFEKVVEYSIYDQKLHQRVFRDMEKLHGFLQNLDIKIGLDLFSFNPVIHPTEVHQSDEYDNFTIIKDISDGLEMFPISVVNSVDKDVPILPRYIVKNVYSKDYIPKEDIGLTACCSCENGCVDRLQCACYLKTLANVDLELREEFGIMGFGYEHKLLLHDKQLLSGIYECNKKCHCKRTCLNRVVQNGMKWKLQLFKTKGKGWGVRTLCDIPVGSFVCNYTASIISARENYRVSRNWKITDNWKYRLDLKVRQQKPEKRCVGKSSLSFPDLSKAWIRDQKSEESVDSGIFSPGKSSSGSESSSGMPPFLDDATLSKKGISQIGPGFFGARCQRKTYPFEEMLKSVEKDKELRHRMMADNFQTLEIPKCVPLMTKFRRMEGLKREIEKLEMEKQAKALIREKNGLLKKQERYAKLARKRAEIQQKRIPPDQRKIEELQKVMYPTLMNYKPKVCTRYRLPICSSRDNEDAGKSDTDTDETAVLRKTSPDNSVRRTQHSGTFNRLRKQLNAGSSMAGRTTGIGSLNPKRKGKYSLRNVAEILYRPLIKRRPRRTTDRGFLLDGKEEGNIGRFLNHCCDPNLFPQFVFVDSHDPRLPWVSFFAKRDIRMGEELTWAYNYEKEDEHSAAFIECLCEAYNCKKRFC